MTMQTTLSDVRPFRNTQANLSNDEMDAIEFFVSAHMTADEIASRLGLLVRDVRDYCKSVYINVK